MAVRHTCGGCPREWTGYAEAHCAACHEHFGGIGSFDTHRSGGACRLPGRLRNKDGEPRLIAQDRASGVVWVFPGYQPGFEPLETEDGTDDQP